MRLIGDIIDPDVGFTLVDAFAYEDYMPVYTGDTVYVGDQLYECVAGWACSNSPPGVDQSGTVWTTVSGRPNDITIETPIVEALPWYAYAYAPEFYILEEGDYFQYDFAGYQCPEGFEATYGYDCAYALSYCMDAYGDLTESVFYGYGFEESRVELYFDEWDYLDMGINWFDLDEIVEELYADMDVWYVTYDTDDDVTTVYWLDGDLFYNWTEDKLFMVIDEYNIDTCIADGTCDPTDNTLFETDAFLAVWEEITLDENSMILYEPYYYEFFEPVDAYDWTTTTSDDFYGSFTFDYGTWCAHNDRIWDCWADDCQDVEPGTEGSEDTWFLTSYEAVVYTEDEMLDMIVPVIECFEYPGEEFPYMAGDVVCDPYYPDFVAWSCLEPTLCTAFMPNLDDLDRKSVV